MRLKSLIVAWVALALVMTGLVSGADAKRFRVACVMPSTINDYSWSQSFYAAMVEIQNEMQDEAAYRMGKKNLEFTFSEPLFKLDDADAARLGDGGHQFRVGAGVHGAADQRHLDTERLAESGRPWH